MPPASRTTQVAPGAGLGLLVAAAWVGLTAWTGNTYHLASVLAAAARGWTVRSSGTALDRRLRTAMAVAGLAATGLGWTAITALGIEPTATILDRQPGGVGAEVIAGALLGTVLGQTALLRALRSRLTSGSHVQVQADSGDDERTTPDPAAAQLPAAADHDTHT